MNSIPHELKKLSESREYVEAIPLMEGHNISVQNFFEHKNGTFQFLTCLYTEHYYTVSDFSLPLDIE